MCLSRSAFYLRDQEPMRICPRSLPPLSHLTTGPKRNLAVGSSGRPWGATLNLLPAQLLTTLLSRRRLGEMDNLEDTESEGGTQMSATEESVRNLDGVQLPEPGTWEVDVAHSQVSFVVRHLMVSKVRGG